MNWQFHFRNFDQQGQVWFGVYHLGCAEVPWHDGRPKCWHNKITYNPTGGNNSVYAPSSFAVNFGDWFKVIVDGLKEVENICMIVASEGTDEDAWVDAVTGIFDITEDTVTAALAQNNIQLSDLIAMSNKAFAQSAAAVGKSPQEIINIANEMGLGGSGFIAGSTYDSLIRQNNNTINNGNGWTILANSGTGNHIANHAFVNNGHMCYYWNSNDLNGFWNTF